MEKVCKFRRRSCLEEDKISGREGRIRGESSDAEMHQGVEALIFMAPRDAAVFKRGI